MQVREVAIAEIVPQLVPLLHLHYNESELSRPAPLHPNWPQIFELNARNIYRAVFLFTSTDELVGYLSFFVLPSIHTSKLVATHDILFVRKDWRIGRGALKLLREADRIMQEAGVTEVFAGHQGIEQLDRLMQHVGYREVGKQYYKAFEQKLPQQ